MTKGTSITTATIGKAEAAEQALLFLIAYYSEQEKRKQRILADMREAERGKPLPEKDEQRAMKDIARARARFATVTRLAIAELGEFALISALLKK